MARKLLLSLLGCIALLGLGGFDTAIFRYPHDHKPTDTPDKVDNERLARMTKGIERVVHDLSR